MARYHHRDNNGIEPKVGDFVAYNMSGQIAAGWIEKISSGRRGPIYHIVCDKPQVHAGRQSTVRGGSQCMLVLQDADGTSLV